MLVVVQAELTDYRVNAVTSGPNALATTRCSLVSKSPFSATITNAQVALDPTDELAKPLSAPFFCHARNSFDDSYRGSVSEFYRDAALLVIFRHFGY